MGIIKRNRINHKAFYRSLQASYLTLRACIPRKMKRITSRNSISFDFLYFTMNILAVNSHMDIPEDGSKFEYMGGGLFVLNYGYLFWLG